MTLNMQSLPARADAVVIGGGIVGSAMIQALAQRGMRDVVLLERDRLGSGTTWHSAANIALIDVSAKAYMDFYAHNMAMFARLPEETGQEVGWRNTGRVQIATNEARVRALKHTQAVGQARGFTSEWIGPDEVKRRLPILSVDGVIGGLWTPTVGRVNATDLIAALAKSARSKGAMVVEHAPVRAIHLDDGAVSSVETEKGTIKTRRVINCAGLWAGEIARLVGVSLPIYANEHFYILTKPFPGIFRDMPSFRDSDALIYGREDVGGLLLGCFETRAKPIAVHDLPKDFSFGLLPDDWEQFEPYMIAAINRIPALEQAEIKMLLNGPESFTPDGRFLAGPLPEVPGFYVLTGMNSAGVNNALGSARAMAALVSGDSDPIDLSPFSPTRFAAFHSRPAWLSERISEAPGQLYSVGRIAREFTTGRNLRLSPLHDRLTKAGAQFRQVMGWERPTDFGDIAAEFRAVQSGVGLYDETSASRFAIKGRRAEDLVAYVFGRLSLDIGECETAVAPSPGGGAVSVMTVARLSEQSYLAIGEADRETADRVLLHPSDSEDATCEALHSAMAQLRLQGPKADELLTWATGVAPPAAGQCGAACIGGAEVVILCEPWGEAFILLTSSEFASYVTARLFAAPAGFGPTWVGERAIEASRITDGIPRLGRELNSGVVVEKSGLRSSGVGRYRPAADGLLKGKVRGEIVGGEPLWSEGSSIGFVTSASAAIDGEAFFMAPVIETSGPVTLNLEGNWLEAASLKLGPA